MRLIDADAIKYTARFTDYADGRMTSDAIITKCEIDSMPTVDPVKHGRWEDCSNGWMCSVCKHDARKDYPYCPYCGARMAEPAWMWKAMRLIDTDCGAKMDKEEEYAERKQNKCTDVPRGRVLI